MILHVDMDAYYASVEERDQPALKGRAVIVGGSADRRGVVCAANYEARRYGVHSAMAMATAIRKCPAAVVLPSRMSHYAAISRQIREIFQRFTPVIEPLALDEAFLDVEGCEGLFGPPPEIARQIRHAILEETQLIASVGVAPNKFLAKIASDIDKPDGLVVVEPDQVLDFLAPLPVSRLWGIGRRSEQSLHQVGIETIGQIRQLSPEILTERFGETGERLWRLAHGIDQRAVVPDREARSISHETTFPEDIRDTDLLRAWLLELTEHVTERLRRSGLRARTVHLKLRYSNFETITRSRSLPEPVQATAQVWKAAADLLENCDISRPVRLIGVGVSNITRSAEQQVLLFEDDAAQDRLDSAADSIRARFGHNALRRGTNPRLNRDRDD